MHATVNMSNETLAHHLKAQLSRPYADFWSLRQWKQFKFVVGGLYDMAMSGLLTNAMQCPQLRTCKIIEV